MKHPLWSAVATVFRQVEELLGQAGGESQATAGAGRTVMRLGGEQVGGLATTLKETDQVRDLVGLRAAVRGQLDLLKATLGETLNERETYLVLFPIVVHFDEWVQRRVFRGQGDWPPLQKELFDIDNGGEVVFDMIDDLVRKEETLPFVFEVFYFCLSDGLRGKHAEDLPKLREYQRKLKSRIPMPILEGHAGARHETVEPPRERSVLWYYAISAAVIAGCYFGAVALVQI